MVRAILFASLMIVIAACEAADGTTLSETQRQLEQGLSAVKRAQTATAETIAKAATQEAKATRQAIDAANTQGTAEAKQTVAA